MKLDSRVVRLGLCMSTASVASAYAALGGLVALVFSVGYIGGFVLWLLVSGRIEPPDPGAMVCVF